MKRNIILPAILILMILSSCVPVSDGDELVTPNPTSSPEISISLEDSAKQVINALAAQDMETVADFVHPHQGVRFSPYTFVTEEHQVFMGEELPGLLASEEVVLWGQYDGSGEPIELTFEEYYEEFVYSSDFANADQVAVNERIGQGNTINNIQEFYPESSFVEYHIPGTEEFGGMDWESLRLVFVQEDGTWMLVGIVHDEWTI